MNYRIRIFLFAETQLVMPMDELYSMENSVSGRTYIERFISEMKWQLFHGLNKEMINPPKMIEKFCVTVDPVRDDWDTEHIEAISIKMAKKWFPGKVYIHTKNGMEEIIVK